MDTTIGRDDEVATIASMLIGGRSVLLVGEAGVGKSHLAASVALQVAASGWSWEWIIGSPSIRSVRFGAIQHLIGQVPISAPHIPALAAERHLRANAGDRPVLLVVDDIDGIDDGSAAVVQALAASGIVVLATVRNAGAAEPAVLPMWKDEHLERVDVRALDPEHTATLVESFLGGPLDSASIDAITKLTLGNPLFVRELLADARAVGSLVESDGAWTSSARLSAHERVADLLAERFENLSSEEHEALELVALAEPLPLSVLQRVIDAAQLEALERAGLIALTAVGPARVVRASHPLLGDVVRSSATDIGTRRLSSMLAHSIFADDAPRTTDLIRAVTWSLDANESPPVDAVLVAAAAALSSFDGSTARRFIEASGNNDSATLVLLGRALLLDNDPPGAVDALTRAEQTATDDAGRASAASIHAEVMLFGLGDRAEADQILADAFADVSELNARAAIASRMMLSAGLRGDFQPALDLGRDLLAESGLESAPRLSVLRMTTLAQMISGQTDGLAEDFDAGIPLALASLDIDPTTYSLLLVTKWMWLLDEMGVEATQREVVSARDATDRPAGLSSMYDSTFTLIDLFRGDGRSAARASARALADPSGEVVGISTLLQAQAAWVHAWSGNDELAMAMHDAALGDPRTGPRERAYLGRARAAMLAHSGDLAGAVEECLTGSAESRGCRLWATWLLHDAVRFGRADAVRGQLESEQHFVDTAFTGLMIDHAGALDDGDPMALLKVAESFATQGAILFAAEAFAQAASVERSPEESARSAQRAWTLFDRTNGIRSVPMDGLSRPLSERETEVARLAAEGVTSRVIAKHLFVSQRTVDNHLQRVYKKLGVGQRSDLSPIFA